MSRFIFFGLVLGLLTSGQAPAQDKVDYTRTRDVIYGRKVGLALTMDVFTPSKPNGIGVIAVVSGGWFSDVRGIAPGFYSPLLGRGYTVFAVVHGSQPKFTITEILEDMNRAARFIRYNAKRFGIDPGRIGVTGASAGGHLSLMLGTAGGPGNLFALDPVDRASSAVQAVGCFFPPTDFLNWGKKDHELLADTLGPPFSAALDYHEFDGKVAKYERITDRKKLREIGKKVSPITHLSAGSAPALLIHGDRDKLVPIQQAEVYVARSKEVGVEAKLVVRPGEEHGWKTIGDDMALIADWFDRHLRKIDKKVSD